MENNLNHNESHYLNDKQKESKNKQIENNSESIIKKGIETALQTDQEELDEISDPIFLQIKLDKLKMQDAYKTPELKRASETYWQQIEMKEKIEEIFNNNEILNPLFSNKLSKFISIRAKKEEERKLRIEEGIKILSAKLEKLLALIEEKINPAPTILNRLSAIFKNRINAQSDSLEELFSQVKKIKKAIGIGTKTLKESQEYSAIFSQAIDAINIRIIK